MIMNFLMRITDSRRVEEVGRINVGEHLMRTYTAVVERDPETGLYVGHVPGFPGAHTQAVTLDELNRNLREVIELLLETVSPSSRPGNDSAFSRWQRHLADTSPPDREGNRAVHGGVPERAVKSAPRQSKSQARLHSFISPG